MIMATVNPGPISLEIHAQHLDGSPKTELAEATVRVYHVISGTEIEVLSSHALSHEVGSSIFRYIWEPSSLAEGMYVAEYTLVDLDGVTAVFPEDLIIKEICPTVEEIDEKLSDEHGEDSWEGGGTPVCGVPKLIPGNGD